MCLIDVHIDMNYNYCLEYIFCHFMNMKDFFSQLPITFSFDFSIAL